MSKINPENIPSIQVFISKHTNKNISLDILNLLVFHKSEFNTGTLYTYLNILVLMTLICIKNISIPGQIYGRHTYYMTFHANE